MSRDALHSPSASSLRLNREGDRSGNCNPSTFDARQAICTVKDESIGDLPRATAQAMESFVDRWACRLDDKAG